MTATVLTPSLVNSSTHSATSSPSRGIMGGVTKHSSFLGATSLLQLLPRSTSLHGRQTSDLSGSSNHSRTGPDAYPMTKSKSKKSSSGSDRLKNLSSRGTRSRSSGSSVSSSTKGKKSVRFALVDKNSDDVKETVHCYDLPYETDAEKEIFYMTKEECISLKTKAKVYAAAHTLQHEEYVQSIERIFDSPLNRKPKNEELSELDAIQIVAQSDARGLEMRCCKLMQKHQRWAINSVTSRYYSLQQEGVVKISEQDTILRSRSVQASQCARDFAIKIALGDELEAKKIYRDMIEL